MLPDLSLILQLSVSMAGDTKAARQLHEDAVAAVFREQLGLDPADNTGAYLQARAAYAHACICALHAMHMSFKCAPVRQHSYCILSYACDLCT